MRSEFLNFRNSEYLRFCVCQYLSFPLRSLCRTWQIHLIRYRQVSHMDCQTNYPYTPLVWPACVHAGVMMRVRGEG